MKTYQDQLKESDKTRMRRLNAKNGYGLSLAMFRSLVKKHRTARAEGNYYAMALIEYRLTDITFIKKSGYSQRGYMMQLSLFNGKRYEEKKITPQNQS